VTGIESCELAAAGADERKAIAGLL
jgi:hypothetical protein